MTTKTVAHPGRHEASEEQKKAAGVTSGYVLRKSQSGVESIFVSGTDVEAPVEEVEAEALESLTVAELKDYANERGINLEGATKKADILALLED